MPSFGPLKQKDLVGIPWMVAFALRADGWYLRSDIIWAKPNPMPESVTDRPTKSHEYLFLLAKSDRYFFDADAVREASKDPEDDARRIMGDRSKRYAQTAQEQRRTGVFVGGTDYAPAAGRNIRSVWTIPTQPYPGAHFAVFPPKLVEPCIKAGTSERGVCAECGAPWRRVVDVAGETARDRMRKLGPADYAMAQPTNPQGLHHAGGHGDNSDRVRTTTGWEPSCACLTGRLPVPAVVLDCFAGSGTVGLVAQRLSRRAVLIDLNPAYIDQQLRRNADVPLGLVG